MGSWTEDQKLRLSEFRSYLREELIAHMPFTLAGVGVGIVLILIAKLAGWNSIGESEFHLAHYSHMIFSGAASAAIFRTYQNSVVKAIPVAFMSTVLFCTLSDILVPHFGLVFLGEQTVAEAHLCILESPLNVVAAALAGVAMGLFGGSFFGHCNRGFHLLHILVSTSASTLYFLPHISFGAVTLLVAGCVLFVALVVPCLVGDLVLPLLFATIRKDRLHEKVHHS